MTVVENPETVLQAEFPKLAQNPLLIEEMIRLGQVIQFREIEHILSPGEVINSLHLVLQGSLKVFRPDHSGRELLLYYVQAGECCAMTLSSILQGEASSIRLVAQPDVVLLLLPVSLFNDFRETYSAWNNFILEVFAKKFGEVIGLIDDLSFHHVDYRLAKYLRGKSQVNGTSVLSISHMKIASDINTSREVISRLLKKMEKEGKLELARERIILRSNFLSTSIDA
jgi:CRP/FNR family transcriptional regulator